MNRKNLIAIAIIAAAATLVAGITVFATISNNSVSAAQETTKPMVPTMIVSQQRVSNNTILFYRQGIVTSMPDPRPGQSAHQIAAILAPTRDGQVYSGILTFTASKKVEVLVSQSINFNITKIVDPRFGSIIISNLPPPENKTQAAIVVITPQYGSTPVPPSASIPFTGNAISLYTLNGEPFVASYSVSYTMGHPIFDNSITQFPSSLGNQTSHQ